MEDQKSDDWLPAGWRVEVRVRKNGKKDKVVIEKGAAEGLPPGWSKEIKITKKGRRVRRDPYYTDPVSGYVFRSMKDALRYVETGDVSRNAFKPKDKSNNYEDLEDDKISSPIEAKNQDLAARETSRQITDKSWNFNEMAKDEWIHYSASTGECSSLHQNEKDQCRESAKSSSLRLPDAEEKEQKEEEEPRDSKESMSVLCPVVGIKPEKQSCETGLMTDEVKETQLSRSKLKRKKELNLPRRTSKRLAGIALDPTPELKTSNRARRSAAQQSDEAVANKGDGPSPSSHTNKADHIEAESRKNCASDTSKIAESPLDVSKSKHLSGHLATPNGHAGKLGTMGNRGEENQECPVDANKMFGLPVDLPLPDLWTDPCIAFAIKTLTGISFDLPESTEMSVGSNNRCSSGGVTSHEEHTGQKTTENERNEKQGSNVASGVNGVNPEAHPVMAEHSRNDTDKPGSSLDLPYADIWRDPCIEFAIKTLTGAIPVGFDLDNQDYFQQSMNSSQAQASSGLPLHDISIDNFCQTDFLCQQYEITEKPVSTCAGNVSLGNPGGARRHQRTEERCSECQR